METQIRTRLLNASPVSAIVGTKVSWGVRPQGEAYPSLVLTIVSGDRPQHMDGLIDARATIVQFDCYGTTRAQSVALRESVIAAILPAIVVSGVTFFQSFVQNIRTIDVHTDTGLVFRDSLDVQVWHS